MIRRTPVRAAAVSCAFALALTACLAGEADPTAPQKPTGPASAEPAAEGSATAESRTLSTSQRRQLKTMFEGRGWNPATAPMKEYAALGGDSGEQAWLDPGDLPSFEVKTTEGKKVGLPLKHTHVSAHVTGFVARVDVTQEYRNDHKAPIEAIYTFPLPANSAVDDLKFTIGSRVIESEIQTRSQARATYNAAKRAGQTAALLEQERPNIFTQSVANIAPGEAIHVTISYVQDLTYDAGQFEFAFPMVVGPRFVGSSVKDADRINPPVVAKGTRSGHDVSLELLLDPALEVVDFGSPNHAVEVGQHDGSMLVALAKGSVIPNRDFLFRYRVDRPETQVSVMAHRESAQQDGSFALLLQPPKLDIEQLVGKREIVFVVDISGSMWGLPLGLAKAAMKSALSRLRPSDTFNVITFSGSTKKLFKAAQPATRANLQQATTFMQKVRAGGGTHLASAIEAALQADVGQGRHRYAFFLTDGYVGGEALMFQRSRELVEAMKKAGQRGRVFGLGIGSSPNRHLLDGLAKAGSGTSVYVSSREEPVAAVNTFFGHIDHPILSDIKVDWGDLEVRDVEPHVIPDLFASRPVILHGRYGKGGSATVTVTGNAGGEAIRIPVKVDLPEVADDHPALETLWARTRIERLMENLWFSREDVSKAVTELGLEHRIVTQWTSLVAVDRSRTVGKGDPKSVRQAVDLPEGVSDKALSANRSIIGALAAPMPAPAMPAAAQPAAGAAPMGSSAGLGFSGSGFGGGGRGVGGLGGPPKAKRAKKRPRFVPRMAESSKRTAPVNKPAARATGRVAIGSTESVVRRRASAIRAVYEKALMRNPNLAGKVVVTLRIGKDGRVLSVTLNGGLDTSFDQALTRLFKRFRFPAGAEERTLKVPLNFKR